MGFAAINPINCAERNTPPTPREAFYCWKVDLFHFLSGYRVGLIAPEDEDLVVTEDLVTLLGSSAMGSKIDC